MGGGITNMDLIDAANATFRAAFDELYTTRPPGVWQLLTEIIPTDVKQNYISVLETNPVMRKWVGEKEFQTIFASTLMAEIEKYEKSFEIDRLDLAADRIGQVARRIKLFMQSNRDDLDKFVFEKLVANPTAYDGVALASASHPRGPAGATQSNTSTTALSFAQHDAVKQVGGTLRDQNGESLSISYDTLIVGPKLTKIAKEITQSGERVIGINASGVEATSSVVAAAAIPNVFAGGDMQVIEWNRLVGTHDDYYIYLDSKRGVKPIHLFMFRDPEAVEQTRSDDEQRFLRDKYRYSVESDFVPAPGAWQPFFLGIL
jgi:phage major head subunit gpT-like protein